MSVFRHLALERISGSELALALSLLMVFYFISNRYRFGISHIPGPFVASFTDLWRVLVVAGGSSQKVDLDLHRKHGPLVRLAPNLISIADSEAISQLYGVTSKFYKSTFYVPFMAHDSEGLIPDPFILTDKSLHSRMKKNGGGAYAMSSIVKMETFADREIKKLCDGWDARHAGAKQPFDLSPWMTLYTVDSVFALTFGEDYGLLDAQEDSTGMLATLERITIYGAIMGQMPFFHRFVEKSDFLTSLVFGSRFVQVFSDMMILANQQVKAFKKRLDMGDLDPDAPATFVERLLQTQKLNPKSLTDRELDAHAMGNISAGGDTTSIALRAIMYYILRNPEAQAKLIAEIDAAVVEFPVSYEVASNLPYLQAVIREAMRLHPSVGLMLARTTPKGGATLAGQFIPEGVDVGVNPWIIHRDEHMFPNPHKFIPERWLTDDAEKLASMNRAYLTFGNGPHTCSGRHISLMEISKLIPVLFSRYEIHLAQPAADMAVNNYWFMFTGKIMVQIKIREKS